jgi:putative transposase
MGTLEDERKEAVRRYLSGESVTSISRNMGRSRKWLYKWLNRYNPKDPNWYKGLSRAPHNIPHKTPPGTEDLILKIREKLKTGGTFYGPLSIQWTMEDLGYEQIPHESTIKNILRRNGKIEQRKSVNCYKPKNIPYPKIEPKGEPNILHEMDFLGPRYLEGGYCFYSLNIMDVGSHRVAINITKNQMGITAVDKLISSWQKLGVPKYLKADNEICFRGSNKYPRAFGAVIRLCLNLGIEPVFIPLSEPWRNGYIEKFQDTFQKMFLRKYYFQGPKELRRKAKTFEKRHNEKYRYSYLKGKTPMQSIKDIDYKIKRLSSNFQVPDLKERPKKGFIHVIRFIRSDRILQIFGERFIAPEETIYQYVKATIDVQNDKLFLFLHGKVIKEMPY